MKLKVFGQLTDLIGSNDIEIAHATDTDNLIETLQMKYPALKNFKYKIAVNRNIIQSSTSLNDDTEIALLPPFSGG